MKKLLITLAIVLLLITMVMAVKPSGERQGSKPNTGVFGQCGEDAQCDDDNPCTTDSCDFSTEPGHCVNEPMVCEDDGDACTINHRCEGGKCVSDPLVCLALEGYKCCPETGCVNTLTDPNNCGGCGSSDPTKVCPSEVCISGTCGGMRIEGSVIGDCTGEGLPGWTINLKNAAGALIAITTTGAGGSYSFPDLMPGDYMVCEEQQGGWIGVTPACIPVVLSCEDMFDVDFVNAPDVGCQ